MITNREEVIDKAFSVFIKMNYEKASIITLAKACGLTKTGIVYYFPHKLDLFIAVADKYVLQMHKPENKFAAPADTLAEFIRQYVAGVAAAMKRIIGLIGEGTGTCDCSPNFYYFHFLSQVRMYYPDIKQKIETVFRQDYELWEKVIQRAKENGEIKNDTDVKKAAVMFRQMFFGLSYEQAFLNGLNADKLAENFHYIYSLLKS
ncbi:TetR/AcrR family transcriptional regulator [uncultured Bacteroides sp.]|uniref:TetR/AcrR family transcriptional regulator n=1 Tax=uncultured Bacteroides sp. TaxID=162156 RepID=UPI0025D35A2B|nr:TetR/AcrR family transcriptional regulator [uncultured Bacteroides sp.]